MTARQRIQRRRLYLRSLRKMCAGTNRCPQMTAKEVRWHSQPGHRFTRKQAP